MTDAILEVQGLSKFFGAVAASDSLTFQVERGCCHALIGPNGAGKSTAIAQITGEVRPDGGSIRFNGREISRWPVHRRARAGLNRSYQITSIFPAFSALDTVALAVLARQPHAFRFWRDARRDERLRRSARSFLDRVGLGDRADVRAGDLAHGEQRQLEVAMVLATNPQLVLLDEPMAGMGRAETQQMLDILRPLKGSLSLLLVEHDMDVVFALADVVTVLVKGRVIASGTPSSIRADADVRRAYLGDGA
ncbi:MAG: ABC transporter ATP-binding protein [Rhodospirillales bacterium]|nr:ABC transporter ATP-binding protein [Rhodospirillales bacterium]